MMLKHSAFTLAATPRRRQLGVGFFGLIFYAVVFGGLGLIGLKSFPIYAEYLKINRVVKKLASDGVKSAPEAAAAFDRYAAIEDISSIHGADLGFDNQAGKTVVSFRYSKKLPLMAPVSLVFDFEGDGR
jgi:Domain of unknown function (DUF4845)